MLLSFVLGAFAAPSTAPCVQARPDAPLSIPLRGPSFAGGLQHRDPFGVPNQQASARVALRWGDGADLSTSEAGAVLLDVEAAIDASLDRGFWPVVGNDTSYLNVYVGNSGDGAPQIDFQGGYVWVDQEGIPYMVVHPAYLTGAGTSLLHHEYFHMVEITGGAFGSMGNYQGFALPDEHQAWFWEASANWFSLEALPDDPFAASNGASFFLAPYGSVHHHQLDGSGAVLDGRQYSAMVFPTFLTNDVADVTMMVDVWRDDFLDADPLDAFDELLQNRGREGIDAAFVSFATHASVLDMTHGEAYGAAVESFLGYGVDDARLLDTVEGVELPTSVEPGPYAPRSFGYNAVRVEEPPEQLEVALSGDADGNQGTESAFYVAWVGQAGDDVVHGVFDGPVVDGTWTLDATAFDVVTLVVTAQPARGADQEEAFSYVLEVADGGAMVTEPTEPTEPTTGSTSTEPTSSPKEPDGEKAPADESPSGGCDSAAASTMSWRALGRRR